MTSRKVAIGLSATLALAAASTASLPAAPLLARSTATHAKETALKDALFRMRQAIDRYYIDKKQYPRNDRKADKDDNEHESRE